MALIQTALVDCGALDGDCESYSTMLSQGLGRQHTQTRHLLGTPVPPWATRSHFAWGLWGGALFVDRGAGERGHDDLDEADYCGDSQKP